MKSLVVHRRLGAGCIVAATIACSTSSTLADTLHVPGDYVTIAAAYAVASQGDEIVVADGTYNGDGFNNLTFNGPAVTLRSENGPENCILDAFYYAGSRMLAISTGPTTVEGITFLRARAGAVFCHGDTTIVNCRFIDNMLYDWGGAINYSGCSVVVKNSTFIDNYASIGGGAFSGYQGSSWIESCIFLRNTGTSGGAVMLSESNATVVNCLFIENAVARYGAAIRNDNPDSEIINCTFLNNHAPWGGAALVARHGSQPTMTNCIIWGDELLQVHTMEGATVTLNYCDISGGWSGLGSNNMDVDPCFIDPVGLDGISGTEDDNLRLQSQSECLDSGNNSAVPGSVTTDLDGNDRISDDVVDLGAYEAQTTPCLGDVDGDDDVDQIDLAILLASYDLQPSDPYYDPRADLNDDGFIDQVDLGIMLAHYEVPC